MFIFYTLFRQIRHPKMSSMTLLLLKKAIISLAPVPSSNNRSMFHMLFVLIVIISITP